MKPMQDSDFNLYIQTQDLTFCVSNPPGRCIPRLKALVNSYEVWSEQDPPQENHFTTQTQLQYCCLVDLLVVCDF